jgi:hypothetical protein
VMTLARTFPIRPAPLPGEALDSWLAALAHRLNIRLGDVLGDPGHAAPFKNGTREVAVPTDWTIALREEEAARIAYATGADPQQLRDITLMRRVRDRPAGQQMPSRPGRPPPPKALINQGCQRAVRTVAERLYEELLDRVKNDAASEKARKELEAALAARPITTKPLRRAG